MDSSILASETATEILLVFGVSFIGASIHEYVFGSEDNRVFFKNPNIWISTLVSSIVSYTIDPWVNDFNPRLMLLPPLLFGMAGMDLVRRLATPEGSSSIIEYILGFFGITNKKTNGAYGIPQVASSTPEKDEEPAEEDSQTATLQNPVLPTSTFEHLMSLDQMVQSTLDNICNLVVDYYVHKDKEAFLRGYFTVKTNMGIMWSNMRTHQFIPITTALKLSEILKKEIELDQVYEGITNRQDEPSGSPTSN